MGNNITCIIDCRLDKSSANDYLTLSLWGKTCFEYICDTVELVDLFSEVHLLTDSPKIKYIAENRSLSVVSEIPTVDTIMLISGKAIFLTKETIEDVINSYTCGRLISKVSVNKFNFSNSKKRFYKNTEFVPSNAFCISDGKLDSLESYYTLKDEEALTINSIYDFELALILKKKQIGRIVLTQSILDRIEEKKENFILSPSRNTICLVGHSQLDNWNLCNINGIAVRNCGIRGISSVDYKRYILDRNLLNCDSDIFVVMHGTNDIVDSYNDEDIVENISKTFDYIRYNNPSARILFILTAHCNGRLDRSNLRITGLNSRIAKAYNSVVECIDITGLDDEYGDLKSEYTIDGLHFSNRGYAKLEEILLKAL